MGSALEARKIPAGEGRLSAEAVGEVELDDKVLVLRRIHVNYQLVVRPEQLEAALRAHQFHKDSCPMARSLRGSIEITTSLTAIVDCSAT